MKNEISSAEVATSPYLRGATRSMKNIGQRFWKELSRHLWRSLWCVPIMLNYFRTNILICYVFQLITKSFQIVQRRRISMRVFDKFQIFFYCGILWWLAIHTERFSYVIRVSIETDLISIQHLEWYIWVYKNYKFVAII